MENNNKKEITLDDLARMVAERLDEVNENVNKGFKKVNENLSELKTSVDNVEANLNKKVDVIKHNDLIYRVEKLEKKVGLAAA